MLSNRLSYTGVLSLMLGALPLLHGCSSTEKPQIATSAMPPSLRAAYIASVQSAAETRSAYGVDGAGVLRSPAQQLVTQAGQSGVSLSSQASTAELALSGYGCEGATSVVNSAVPSVTKNRVEYAREGFSEWYVNGPLGLEQGFTVAAPPSCAKIGRRGLEFQMDWRGSLSPTLSQSSAGDQRVELRDNGGHMMLAYSDLHAFDAAGRRLPAHLSLAGQRMAIHVDDRDAQYPVTVDPLIWVQQGKLLSSDGASADTLGTSVSISGDTAVVGDPMHDPTLTNQGAAYVFVRSNAQWTQQARLTALTSGGLNDGAVNDNFGQAVAISGDTVIVGAPNATVGGMSTAGAAYVFLRIGTSWGLQAKLTAPTPASTEQLGRSVAIDVDIAIAGAPGNDTPGTDAGAAYAFTRTASTWGAGVKLAASDAATGDGFGSAVAVSGMTAVIGSPRDDTGLGTDAGSAYVFVNSGTWGQQMQLVPTTGTGSDNFGTSVGVSVDTAIVGAPNSDPIFTNQGAAFVFTRNGTTWSQQQRLTASDASSTDNFGQSVAVNVDTAVVGSPLSNLPTTDAGAIYVYTRTGTTWTQQSKQTASDGAFGDTMGQSVAVSGNTAIAGAPNRYEVTAYKGAAYVFYRGGSQGDSCVNPVDCAQNICLQSQCHGIKVLGASCTMAVECASGFCADGVCCNTACGGGAADCQSCTVALGSSANGTCGMTTAGVACRTKTGECDLTEVCDGVSPTCPQDQGLTDGMACAFGTCVGGKCMGEVPLSYIPPGAQATGCELTTLQSSSRAPAFAIFFALAALALLLRRGRA